MEIVFTHNNMDFDSLAAAYGVTKLYPAAKIALGYPLYGNVRRFVALYRSNLPVVQIKYVDLSKVTKMYVVDCQQPERLDEHARKLLSGAYGMCPVVVFDHHYTAHGGLMSRAHPDSQVEAIGSSTTLLVERIIEKNIQLNSFEATLLATGIYEDTGCLMYGGTTDRDALAVAHLLKCGADLLAVGDHMRPKLSEELIELLETLLDNTRRLEINGVRLVVSYAKSENYIDGLATLTRKIAEIESADASICAVYMRDRVHIVGRSDTRALDVRNIVRDFGGDGHPGAASAVAKSVDLDWVMQRIEELAYQFVRPEITASKIMSTPVRTIVPQVSMDEASRIMTRYGLDGLLVVENEKVEGVVSRRDIDQATHHKLGHAPVIGFMSRPVISIAPDTPLSKIQEILVNEDIGRLAVLDESKKLIGLVSRADVLTQLFGPSRDGVGYGTSGFLAGIEGWEHVRTREREVTRSLQAQLESVDDETIEIFKLVGATAAKLNMVAYAVGGFVRDLILGVQNLDLDFVIEGSAIELANQLQSDFPGQFEVKTNHERFQTSHLYFHGAEKREVDLSTARIEFYDYPAALPTVEPSKLEQDLLRRDFTINTLALRLNPEQFGELVDMFGGYQDIQDKTIRILHPFSFIEDPTRIVRAAKFSARLGFAINERTLEQAKRAVSMGIFDDLGGTRMKNELMAILDSPHRLDALNLLAGLGARLCYLDSHLEFTSKTRKRIRWTERLLNRYSVKDEWIVFLGVLLSSLPQDRVPMVLDRLHLQNVQKENIIKGLEIPSNYPDLFQPFDRRDLETRFKRSEIYKVLGGKSDQSLAIAAGVAAAGAPIRRLIKTYLGELESTKLEITGADLINLGVKQGPTVGEILRLVFEAKLDGAVSDRASELDLARCLSATTHVQSAGTLSAGANLKTQTSD
ncbi:MAG TPA: CBS domain-containing protein [Oculatellaceae cyanobacterium]